MYKRQDPYHAPQPQSQVPIQIHTQPPKYDQPKPQKEEEPQPEKPKTTAKPVLLSWKPGDTESSKPKQETPAQTEPPKPEPKKESKKPAKDSKSGQDQKIASGMERVTPQVVVVPDVLPMASTKAHVDVQNFHKETSNSSQKPQRNLSLIHI